MSANLPKHWAPSHRAWQIAPERRRFVSPRPHGDDDEFLIGERVVENGFIEGNIAFRKGVSRDAAFLFRYETEHRAYLAGLGGWNSRYYIAKMHPQKDWRLIGKVGSQKTLEESFSFLLRVEFEGSHIRLFDNKVLQLEVEDTTYSSGRMGFYASRSKVVFSDVRISQRTCLVVMPFHPDFDRVYQTIKSVAEGRGFTCLRADKKYVSRPVMIELIKDIRTSDLIVVDLTNQSPSVYYEAGLAHALGKRCIILAESENDVGFDLKQMNALFYGSRRHPRTLQTQLSKWFDTALTEMIFGDSR